MPQRDNHPAVTLRCSVGEQRNMSHKIWLKSIASIVLALWCLGRPGTGTAAMLDLSDTPLFLTIKAIPNILFLIDDSGSMDWETMTKDLANEGRVASNQPDGSNDADAGS